MSKPIILGHRGDREDFEDNTLEGIESAFKKGAEGVEMDVYYRKDKGVYLAHQYLHDRDLDYPKLEEVLEKFGDKGKIQIEIKPPEMEVVEAVVDVVERLKPRDFELSSSVLPILSKVRKFSPDAKTGMIMKHYFFEDWMTEEYKDYLVLNYLTLTGANILTLDSVDYFSKERVALLHGKGYVACTHLATDSKEDYDKAVSMGIDICTADSLDVLKA